MKLIAEKIQDVISKETAKSPKEKKPVEVDQLLNDLKKAGLIKQSNYNLPLVDTIGKTYYTSINKRK